MSVAKRASRSSRRARAKEIAIVAVGKIRPPKGTAPGLVDAWRRGVEHAVVYLSTGGVLPRSSVTPEITSAVMRVRHELSLEETAGMVEELRAQIADARQVLKVAEPALVAAEKKRAAARKRTPDDPAFAPTTFKPVEEPRTGPAVAAALRSALGPNVALPGK